MLDVAAYISLPVRCLKYIVIWLTWVHAKLIQCDDSMCRGPGCQALWSEFNLQVPRGRKREPKLLSAFPGHVLMYRARCKGCLPLYSECFRGHTGKSAKLIGQLACLISEPWVQWETISQNKVGRWPLATSCIYMCIRTHLHLHKYIHTYHKHFKKREMIKSGKNGMSQWLKTLGSLMARV